MMEGTTSACAENTVVFVVFEVFVQNYLRVRGEYKCSIVTFEWLLELPPRARRIRLRPRPTAPGGGTTSACAENTFRNSNANGDHWNYLRVRGEYDRQSLPWVMKTELPPRARRILHDREHGAPAIGTTSACAENTF